MVHNEQIETEPDNAFSSKIESIEDSNNSNETLQSTNNSPITSPPQPSSNEPVEPAISFRDKYCNRRFASLIILSFSLMLLFSAFHGTQSYIPIIHGDMGFWILVIFYFVFALTTFLIPAINDLIGSIIPQISAAIPFAILVMLVCVPYWWICLISSIFAGFACGAIWVSNGLYISTIAEKEMGLYSGVFFSIFILNGLAGNVISGFLFTSSLPLWLDCLIMVIIIIIAGLIMYLLIPLNRGKIIPKTKKSLKENFEPILRTFKLFFDKRMILLLPLFIYHGYSLGFYFGNFPALVGSDWAGFTMAAVGATEFVFSILIGKLSDWLGVAVMLTVGMIFQAGAITMTFFMHHYQPYLFFVTAILVGIGDISLCTLIYIIIGGAFKTSGDAFAIYRFVQSLFISVGMLMPVLLPLLAFQICLFVINGITIICYFILEFAIIRRSKQKN